MVVLRRKVRATSVPVATSHMAMPYEVVADVAMVRRISGAALDDTDALMMASKRHDQQLLSAINARLASASFNQPVTVKRSTTTYSSSKDKPPTGRPAMPLRRLLALDHDDEEELIDMPSIPATRSVIRSSSVPPRLLPLPPRDATTRHHVIRTDSHVVPPEVAHHHGVQVYGKVLSGVHEPYVTNHPSFSLSPSSFVSVEAPITVSMSPVADLAVRQAHRNLDRIDKEIKHNYGPNGPRTFSSKTYVEELHPMVTRRVGARSSARLPPTYSGSVAVRRTASVSPSRTSFHYHRDVSPSPSELLLLSSVSPSPAPSLPAHHGLTTTTLSSDLQTHPTKVDWLKRSVLEVESPLLLPNVYKHHTVAAAPYTAYVSPVSTYVSPATVHVSPPSVHVTPASTYVAPHVTAHVITAPVLPHHGTQQTDYMLQQPTSARPKVSETRRKVRQVLCKMKKDPHYFD